MLYKRLIFGFTLIAALVGAVWLDSFFEGRKWLIGDGTIPPGVVAGVGLLLLSALASSELSAIYRAKGIASSRRLTVTAGWLGLAVCGLVPSNAAGIEAVAIAGAAAIAVLVGALVFYARNEKPEGVIAATGTALLAFVYLGMAFGFVLLLRREHPAWVLLWVLVVTKSCDIGAYFTGRLIGRTKLIPWLSPGKTWEGLAGGVVLSAIVGAVGAWLLGAAVPPGAIAGAGIGVVLGVVGQFGDLLASLLKRDAGIKDSGQAVPGFGGWLDVLDSPLLAMPAAYWMLKLVV